MEKIDKNGGGFVLIISIAVFVILLVPAFAHLHMMGAEPTISSIEENGSKISLSTKIQLPKYVALTFDDGPYGTSTDAILTILEREKVPATFFLIGKNAKLHPDEIRREIADGDVVGNHSFSHTRALPSEATTTLRVDVSRAEEIIATTTGLIPELFRAPYGATSPNMVGEIEHEGYTVVGWDIDTKDWVNTNSSTTIIATVMNNIRPNNIILFHDGHETGASYSRNNTIEALSTLIEDLRAKGYTFVTVDKILHVKAYQP